MSFVLQIKGSEWKTPASSYPVSKVRSAEIRKSFYRSGFYNMEGVDGYVFCQVKGRLPVTTLWIKGQEWMLDDPLHWIGMKRLAENAKGKVLVAGLGLGLVTQALLQNPEVTEVVVVDINPDVIDLIYPLLPKSQKLHVVCGDFFKYERESKENFDVVILDLWVLGNSDSFDQRFHVWAEIQGSVSTIKFHRPNDKVWVWGINEPELNPSIIKTQALEDWKRKYAKAVESK